MSTNLYWQAQMPSKPTGDDRLKHILQRGWGTRRIDSVIGEDAISYLTGLSDAGIIGAEELIEAIRLHGSIRVFEQ